MTTSGASAPVAHSASRKSATRACKLKFERKGARLCRQPQQITIAGVSDSVNLTHHFLSAMPAMTDPHFANSLTYVCEHNPEGALGIVVNKPIDLTLEALFEQIEIPLADRALCEAPVHFGGPVQLDRGFVLHRPIGNWQSTLPLHKHARATTS